MPRNDGLPDPDPASRVKPMLVLGEAHLPRTCGRRHNWRATPAAALEDLLETGHVLGLNEYRRLLPDATATLRQHKISWKRTRG